MGLCISLLILIRDGGPVFYVQQRSGKRGMAFDFYKFRTMKKGSEPDGPRLSIGELDPRVTTLGRWLRRTKLDELPQIWNVFKGDMSWVGPRPERPFFVNQIKRKDDSYQKLLTIRPGVTSLGQIEFGYGHNVEDLVERMKIDLKYLDEISFTGDLKILLSTIQILLYITPKPKKSKVLHT